MKRRDFVKVGALGSAAFITNSCSNTSSSNNEQSILLKKSKDIKVVSTRISGIDANKEAFRILQSNGSAINAIEKGLT